MKIQISVFLDYRRLGKVYPVAKAHRLSRSTVAGIVEDFLKKGFSRGPRLDLPRGLLTKLQERHLQGVMAELQRRLDLELKPPKDHVPAVQLLGEGGEERITLEFPESGRSLPGEGHELVWHLRGTTAENILGHVRQALRQFDLQCQGLWNDLRAEIERVSSPEKDGRKVQVRPYQPRGEPMEVSEPYLPHELVNLVYNSLFGSGFEGARSPDLWRPASGDPAVLMAGPVAVAVGEEIHEAVRWGISNLVANGLDGYRRRARELDATFCDLSYLSAIVTQALSEVIEEEVRQGICHKCPYPEALLDLRREEGHPSGNGGG